MDDDCAVTVHTKHMNKLNLTVSRIFPYLLSIGGGIGFLAAFILTSEKIKIIKDPTYELSCNLNPLLSCGSVMTTPQAEVFGFPNSLIGIAGFAIITCIGMSLLAGAKFNRWFWVGMQLGVTFGICFVFWLQYQSIFIIGALCQYCMIVWTVMIPIFLYTTVYNLRKGNIKTPPFLEGVSNFIQRYNIDILIVWYIFIIVTIIYHFWYFWSTLFQIK